MTSKIKEKTACFQHLKAQNRHHHSETKELGHSREIVDKNQVKTGQDNLSNCLALCPVPNDFCPHAKGMLHHTHPLFNFLDDKIIAHVLLNTCIMDAKYDSQIRTTSPSSSSIVDHSFAFRVIKPISSSSL